MTVDPAAAAIVRSVIDVAGSLGGECESVIRPGRKVRMPTTARTRSSWLGAALRLRALFRRSPGAIRLSLQAAPVARTFWTLSTWESQEALDAYARHSEHVAAMRRFRPHMAGSTFVTWTTEASSPPAWEGERCATPRPRCAGGLERPARGPGRANVLPSGLLFARARAGTSCPPTTSGRYARGPRVGRTAALQVATRFRPRSGPASPGVAAAPARGARRPRLPSPSSWPRGAPLPSSARRSPRATSRPEIGRAHV